MDDNKEAVADFFSTIAQVGVGGAIEKWAADDFIWWVLGVGEMQDSVASVAGFAAERMGGHQSYVIHDIIAEGDKAAAETELLGRLDNGSIYNNRYHFKFFFDNGKIKRINEYFDTKHADEIWSPVFGSLEGLKEHGA